MRHSIFYLPALILALLFTACSEQPGAEENETTEEDFEDDNYSDARDDISVPDSAVTMKTIELEARDFVYFPPEIVLPPGQEVQFVITNTGQSEHSFELHLPAGEIELASTIPPGESDTLRVNLPMETGTYTFYCPVDKHHSQGMEGRIIIQEE